MLLTLGEALSAEAAGRLCSALLSGGTGAADDAARVVTDGVRSHPLFVIGVQPHSLSRPTFHCYNEGMESAGATGEAVVVGGAGGVRADVGIEVFLSARSSYDGGELVVDSGFGDESIKEEAGTCVVYPAAARRGVKRVTRGTRWTAELWAQSLIRAPAQREILYDIGCSLHLIEMFGPAHSLEVERLRRCHQNLLRLWAEL